MFAFDTIISEKLGVPERLPDFIQGRIPMRVGAMHYMKCTRICKKTQNLLIQPVIANVKGGQKVSFISKLKTVGIQTLAPTVFYGAVGIIFLVLLPLANFPPHIGLTGILSLVTAYGILKKRFWALWLVVALFAVATVFSLYTLYVIAFTNVIVGVSMIIYAVLTWLVTLYIMLKRKPTEA